MDEQEMTEEQKAVLVGKVAELSAHNVLNVKDMLDIMKICREACDRKIESIAEKTKPEGPIQ